MLRGLTAASAELLSRLLHAMLEKTAFERTLRDGFQKEEQRFPTTF